MVNIDSERTFLEAIIEPGVGHINGVIGFMFKDINTMALMSGIWASLPIDFLIKIIGKANMNFDSISGLPVLDSVYSPYIIGRALKLNCLSDGYAELANRFIGLTGDDSWARLDSRLDPDKLKLEKWNSDYPIVSDYQRREALVEIDVLVAMALKMSLEQLKTIYRIQFPVLYQNEHDTWYDRNGRIVFTGNKGLFGVGLERQLWNNLSKNEAVDKYVEEDSMPNSPISRTIVYEPPYVQCDREQDYEEIWTAFEERFKNK